MTYQPPPDPGQPAYPPYTQGPPQQWPPQQGYATTWPQQGQPYRQPGPPPGPPQRRRRHTGRNIGIGAGAVIAAVVVIAAAMNGGTGHTITSTSTSSPAATPKPKAKTRTAPAGIGSPIVLAGNDSGEQMTVTVTKVFRHAQAAGEFDGPPAGKRLYAVQFRLADTGSVAYSDAPSNGAVVVDASGQSYDPALDDAAGCQSFPGTENIAPGSSGLGCVVFEVPGRVSVVTVQFTLDSGMGPQTGQWDVALKGAR